MTNSTSDDLERRSTATWCGCAGSRRRSRRSIPGARSAPPRTSTSGRRRWRPASAPPSRGTWCLHTIARTAGTSRRAAISQAMMDELFGRATGCSGGWGGSMHLIDRAAGFMGTSAIVCGRYPDAVGCGADARGCRPSPRLGRGRVRRRGGGGGRLPRGAELRGARSLPVVFVCENNEWAAFSRVADRQPHGRSTGAPPRTPCPASSSTATTCSPCTAPPSRRCGASGEGLTLLECRTYRWLEHCGPNEDHVSAIARRGGGGLARAHPIERARRPASDAERPRRARARGRRDRGVAGRPRARAPWPTPTHRKPPLKFREAIRDATFEVMGRDARVFVAGVGIGAPRT